MMTDLAAIIVKIAYGSTDREVVPNGPNQPPLHHFLVGFMIAAFHTRKHVQHVQQELLDRLMWFLRFRFHCHASMVKI
jgi:hypothetical protein